MTEVERDQTFAAWIQRVQLDHRLTVGYLRGGDEARPYHGELNIECVKAAWREIVGAGNVVTIQAEPYRKGGGALL